MINILIRDELTHPDKYKPFTRGPLFACLIAFICITTIPFFILYRLIKKFVQQKTRGTVFYDSVLFGLLFLLYPVYLFLIAQILSAFNFSPAFIFGVLILHPITAYFATQNKANEISEANQSFH